MQSRCGPLGGIAAELLFQVVVVGRCVLDGIVQNRRHQRLGIVDAKNVPHNQAGAKDVGGVGRLPVLPGLVAVGPRRERHGFQQVGVGGLQ